MIPSVSVLTTPIEEVTHPTRTYKTILDENLIIGNEVYRNRIDSFVDDLPAIEQAIYMILGTERYKFPIYSWDYGVELVDLYGQPMPYVIAELPRRIKEALLTDDRITDVVDFEFETHGKKLHTTFTVVTVKGNISTDLEVEV